MVECLHGTGWRADDRQGNEAGARTLTGFSFWGLQHNPENMAFSATCLQQDFPETPSDEVEQASAPSTSTPATTSPTSTTPSSSTTASSPIPPSPPIPSEKMNLQPTPMFSDLDLKKFFDAGKEQAFSAVKSCSALFAFRVPWRGHPVTCFITSWIGGMAATFGEEYVKNYSCQHPDTLEALPVVKDYKKEILEYFHCVA